MIAAWKTGTLYSLFGAISTLVNLTAQWASTRVYQGDFAIEASVLLGTAAGLPVKYILDRRYIFLQQPTSVPVGWEFLSYSLTGVITTLVFWVVEWSFYVVLGTEFWRLLGGAIGLSVGFILKYQLDKHFVFRAGESKPESEK